MSVWWGSLCITLYTYDIICSNLESRLCNTLQHTASHHVVHNAMMPWCCCVSLCLCVGVCVCMGLIINVLSFCGWFLLSDS